MNTINLSTLKIHKLTQAQYDRELANGNIDEHAIYLTPEEEIDLSPYATTEQLNEKADASDLVSHTENKSNPHGVTAEQVGAVPTSRTINGKALSSDVTITASELGCAPMYTYGTTDLTAGSSALEEGKLYFVYE